MKDSSLPVIACVLRKSYEYDVDYVERLVEGIKNNISYDNVEIVCLSDIDVSNLCKWLPLKNDWPKWWGKLELFSHPYLKNKPIRYFDLDTIIKGDITPFIMYNHIFTGLKGFIRGRFASGLMAWNGNYSYITKKFSSNSAHYIKTYVGGNKLGDQDFINDFANIKFDFAQDLFPGLISSNKLSDRKSIKESHIVCFHGHPRPRRVNWTCKY